MSVALSPVSRIGLVCLAGSLLAVTGCSGSKITTKASNELPRYQIKTIALVPFTTISTPQLRDQGGRFLSTPQSVRGSDISLEVQSNVEPPLGQTVIVPGAAAERITQLFWTRLRNRAGVVVSSPSDVGKAAAMPSGDLSKSTPDMTAAAVAKRLKQDAALIGQVLVYQERVGSRLGANPPASVGFEIKVVAADGQVLWVGNYYERQRPMNEDFMGFIHRWAFVTADELARYGVDEVLKEFPFGTGSEK
ncbi:MAG: hypothetical protein LZF86_110531 [Nitrospira sp.]|nr:MAG: hypothetical protein LZF86_110531 [Nitrospira sp.]